MSAFYSINSLQQLRPYLQEQREEDQKILLLDLDNTLLRRKEVFGSKTFHAFLDKQCKEKKIKFKHRSWFNQANVHLEHEPCELISKVNRVVREALDLGWKVKILTARHEEHKKGTEEQLKKAKIPIDIEDVIFSKSKKYVSKWKAFDEAFKLSDARILFVDDIKKNCADFFNDSQANLGSSVQCFVYKGSHPKKLTRTLKQRLLVQLDAFRQNKMTYHQKARIVELAKQRFKIKDLTDESLFETVLSVVDESRLKNQT